jgi:hypothetical protein
MSKNTGCKLKNIFAFLTSKLRQLCTKNCYVAAKSAKIESDEIDLYEEIK